jgi:hypothetical protein
VGGHDALGDDAPLAVDVGDEGVERPHALLEPGGPAAPTPAR